MLLISPGSQWIPSGLAGGATGAAVLGRDRHRHMGGGREGKPPWQHQHAPIKPRVVTPGQRFVFQRVAHGRVVDGGAWPSTKSSLWGCW